MSRVLLLLFRGDSPENPSVRSMTSSVGVVAPGEADLDVATLRFGRGSFSSSSEDMTYTAQRYKSPDNPV